MFNKEKIDALRTAVRNLDALYTRCEDKLDAILEILSVDIRYEEAKYVAVPQNDFDLTASQVQAGFNTAERRINTWRSMRNEKIKKGWTQAQVAKKAGIAASTYSNLERKGWGSDAVQEKAYKVLGL